GTKSSIKAAPVLASNEALLSGTAVTPTIYASRLRWASLRSAPTYRAHWGELPEPRRRSARIRLFLQPLSYIHERSSQHPRHRRHVRRCRLLRFCPVTDGTGLSGRRPVHEELGGRRRHRVLHRD